MTNEQAIKILQRDLAIQKENKALPDGIAAMELAIKALQSQKVGRWISTNRTWQRSCNDYCVYEYVCSECKAISYFRHDSEQRIVNGCICPNCMAKMEEGE